ncbi:MAG TPA: DUF222 domain-containing protein, partial [Galbitalea sp.]|nr:DUF222 domain-containing protein [Galbitalea sp.]
LDLDAIERGQKQRAAIRYVRVWSRDGISGGSWALPDEDGGLEIRTALKLLVAKKTNGPRFAETVENNPLGDDRSPEQIMADGFVQVFHNGLTADPSIVPGAGRAPVRVIVPEHVLTDRVANSSDTSPSGSAILEETHTAISFGKLEEHLCEGGTVGIVFTETGQVLDTGREQRLFSKTQRTALGVRDGGCRYPGCEKPPSWCEAHHISYWARDTGATNVANGILLCRYHHMLIHNTDWEIIRDTRQTNSPQTNSRQTNSKPGYWLKPPKEHDPDQHPIEMPTKNPLTTAMKHAHAS